MKASESRRPRPGRRSLPLRQTGPRSKCDRGHQRGWKRGRTGQRAGQAVSRLRRPGQPGPGAGSGRSVSVRQQNRGSHQDEQQRSMTCGNWRRPGAEDEPKRRGQKRLSAWNSCWCRRRALGTLLELGEKIAGITGYDAMDLGRKMVVVMAGDHGVTAEGVGAYPSEVTGQMVRGFAAGVAGINVLCRHAGIEVRVVDMGCAANLLDLVARGCSRWESTCTAPTTCAGGPPSTGQEAITSIERGAQHSPGAGKKRRSDAGNGRHGDWQSHALHRNCLGGGGSACLTDCGTRNRN